jgi:hypothetical protein
MVVDLWGGWADEARTVPREKGSGKREKKGKEGKGVSVTFVDSKGQAA